MAVQILNVDGRTDTRQLRSQILCDRGYEVVEAISGRHALEVAAAARPEVILLDVDLPDMSGIDVCRRIKADPPCDHAVVILVSSSELATDLVLEGFAAGADMCLRDHLDHGALAVFIDAAIRRRQTVVELQHDRSHAQLELGETLRRYRSMFDNAPYAIYHALEDGTVLDGNRPFLDLLGCSTLAEAQAIDINGVFEDPSARDQLVARWRSGRTGKEELLWRVPGGRRIHVSVSGRVLERNAEVFEIFVEDVTERRRLEADFHHNRKMEAIGRLAGGIAHDLNNWLTVIVGYAEMLLDETTDSATRDGLQEILSASRASMGVTSNLLAFSRKQILQLQTIDLNRVVSEFHQLLDRIIGEDIKVRVDLSPGPVSAKADPTQIQQVLMNLAVNARDAMPRGGSLTVRTGERTLEEDSLPDKRVAPGAYAFIVVEDSGVGMSAEVRDRLFEPFFTTKESGKGTGLGMAVVYGIVKQLSGYITVESTPGRGTTVTMYLPVAEDDVLGTAQRRDRGGAEADSHGRRILLVEDEEPVRTLTKKLLDRAGYDVTAAADAEEALRIFEDDPAGFALILTDVVMPGLSGPDMLSRMVTTHQIPALLMSGYPDLDDAVVANSPFQIIPKPFTADALLFAVRDALARSAGAARSR